jgi:hypothetical protein
MNERQTKQYEMLARVRLFASTHAPEFLEGTLATELISKIRQTVERLSDHSIAKTAGTRTAREGTASRLAARDELRADLNTIRRTARVMSSTIPNAAETFRISKTGRDRALLDQAKVIAKAAAPHRAEFARRALSDAFFEKLDADIAALEAALALQRRGRDARVEATAAIEGVLGEALGAVRELDSIIRNTYPDGSPLVTAWASASRVARSGRGGNGAKASAELTSPTSQEDRTNA